MAYELSWVVPSRIMLIKLEGEVSIEEMTQMIDETHAHVNSGQAPVHILIDAANLHNKPVNFQQINQISTSMANPSTGWWVLVNAGKMVGFTASVLSKLVGVKLKTAATIKEARTILERVDLTLEPENPTVGSRFSLN
jgi:hypothetical protein